MDVHISLILTYLIGSSVTWKHLESTAGTPHFVLTVEIRTVISSTISFHVTFSCLVVFLMVLLLLPAMGVHAPVLQFAPFPVHLDFPGSVPTVTASLGVVIKDVRLTAEVLPVVGVFALFPNMDPAVVIEWTPNCLEVEHVKVDVFFH